MTRPKVSLCMIVRDEAEMLPRFLEHAEGLWDELCVVDTGSRDDTVALLESAGARVIRRPWDDDFSAARNAGLVEATGEWILYLDADEMPSPSLEPALRSLVADEGAGAATIVMRNEMPSGHARRTPLLRLFRNDASIRFRYPIHEDVSASVSRYLARTGRRLAHLDGGALHLGYVRDRAAARDKKARDLALLSCQVEAEPTDLYCWFKLLELARFWNDVSLLRERAEHARLLIEANDAPAPQLAHAPWAGELIVLVAQGVFSGKPKEALAFLDRWESRVPSSAAFYLRRAELHEALGSHVPATHDFIRCVGLRSVTHDEQLATVRPLMGLARLALLGGDLVGARRHVEGALGHAPRDREALLAAVVLARARGGRSEADAFAASHATAHGPSEELDEALGEGALIGGSPDEAVAYLGRAAGAPPSGPVGLRLAQALLMVGEVEAAGALAAHLFAREPAAGLGVLVCDLARGRDTDLTVDLDPEQAAEALRPWVDAAVRCRSRQVTEVFRRSMPAVEPIFPWLPEYVAQLAAAAA